MIPLLRIADTLRRLVWRVFGPRTIGIRGLVVDGDGRVLLVRHSYGRPAWHLPGGGVKRREALRAALERELREEVDVTITGSVRLLGTYSSLGEGKSDHISVFVVEHWRRTTTAHEDAEIAATGFFALDDLPEATSPGTRRRLAEWANGANGNEASFDW
ncbi:MAG: NUDIX domain-containing protein [Actinomycetota bacterium]|nr:NUDIX domain-containing protein [Actinomycetota bacterium]